MALGRAVYRIVAAGSGAGKTSLGVKLVKELASRHIPVAVIKHASKRLDVEGKDTARYSEAGAGIIVASSPFETMVLIPRGMEDLDLLLPLLPPRIFVVLVEGFRRSKRGKRILVAGKPGEIEELACSPRDTLAVVGTEDEVLRAAEEKGCTTLTPSEADKLAEMIREDAVNQALSLLPGVDCGYCGYPTCRMFAELVVRGEKAVAECPLAQKVSVTVDGARIPLNPYVKNVFWSVLRALMSTLKGVPEEPRSIEVRVKLD